jgi:hypothetical protein
MDNDVHRFSRKIRKGQRRPVGTDRMTNMTFSPAAGQHSAIRRAYGIERVFTGMNVNIHRTAMPGPH